MTVPSVPIQARGPSTGSRVVVPATIQPPQPHSFPLLASLAPVVMSVAIWLVTSSPFALMFAALGPAAAIASVADARRQSKRHARSERARFDSELQAARADIRRLHDRERDDLDLDAPGAAERLGRGDHDPERWSSRVSDVVVTIGRGARASALQLDVPSGRGPEAEALADLAALAGTLADAPIVVPAAHGIAIIGPASLADSVARGVLAQLAVLLSPASTMIVVPHPPAPDSWLSQLPHRLVVDTSLRDAEVHFRAGDFAAVVAVGESIDAVPSSARVVLRVGANAELVRHPDRSLCGPLVAEYVSREQAVAWARRLESLQGEGSESSLPDSVPLAGLLPEAAEGAVGLSAPIGIGQGGPVAVDLVGDGPHAIVGGTTGSGKSELLVSWVLALAARHPPDAVNFLLVDFKGGASFSPLEPLPHCVGVISDLDSHGAVRALESLTAEVRLRERTLAAARVRSIDELPSGMPRLVIVVDEFAAVVSDFPDLHELFSDLAARGRSLGLHLVLCTQRPSVSVRDTVLANAGLRVSLRVNNGSDSRAVIGTDAAAGLPATPLGRALLSVAGESPRALQVAIASPGDTATVVERWRGRARGRRPWRDPLPSSVDAGALAPSPGIAFGIADHPNEQAQPTASWDPSTDGHVLVVGAGRSGKTGFLRALGVPAIPADPENAWDGVAALLADIRAARGGRVVALDDLDAVLARFGDEHADAFLDALAAVLREGPARDVHLAIAVQRITPRLHAVQSLCGSTLLLRMPSRQEHVLAGGRGTDFDGAAPPGRGDWHGHPVQVADVAQQLSPIQARPELVEVPVPVVVVTGSVRSFAARARERGATLVEPGAAVVDGNTVVLGDPDAWQARWGALQAAGATLPVYFEGVSLTDYRMLTRSRELPPPIVDSGRRLASHSRWSCRTRPVPGGQKHRLKSHSRRNPQRNCVSRY